MGTPDGLEAGLVRDAGLSYHSVRARGFDRASKWSLLPAAATLAVSAVRAVGLLRRVRPDVVVCFGGYVSLSVGLAAALLRIPLMLHEQNSVPGLANRVLSRWAAVTAVTYEASVTYLHRPERAEVTGNPVRSSVLNSTRDAGRRTFGLPAEGPVLLAFGGSQGARHLNDAMLGIRDALLRLEGVSVMHVAGRRDAQAVRERASSAGGESSYRVLDYIDDMGAALAAADLVVARAGATSIAEITAVGRAAVLVPYPFATEDHQAKNARTVEEGGGAVVVPDDELDGPVFAETVLGLLDNRDAREKMATASAAIGRPDAAAAVASLARRLARGGMSDGGPR